MEKKLVKIWKQNIFREYHDIYLRSDVLLLANVFESFRKMCLKISAPGLAWQAALKKTEVELELLKDINMLSNGECVMQFFIMQKLTTTHERL